MKVLVCCVPQAGHFNPVAGLIRSLVDGGDEVVVAGSGWLEAPALSLGAAFRPAGSSLDEWFGRLRERTRGIPGEGLPVKRILHYFLPRLFAEIGADDMMDDVLAVAKTFQPDLLVHDTEAFVGPLVADLVGARSANHLFGPLIDNDVLTLATDALAPLWSHYGREVPRHGGIYRDLTIAVCPPSLDPRPVPAGEMLYLQPASPPSQILQPQSPPLVYVTFGTLWGNPELLRLVLRAAADEPVHIVATSGQVDPEAVQTAAGNARIERFIPQAELLPRCSAVLHHAGAGTMFGALAHGLPQVALPQAADNFVNAELLATSGTAQVLTPEEVTPEAITRALRTVLDDPGYRARAQQVAAEIAAMPNADSVAGRLRGFKPG